MDEANGSDGGHNHCLVAVELQGTDQASPQDWQKSFFLTTFVSSNQYDYQGPDGPCWLLYIALAS